MILELLCDHRNGMFCTHRTHLLNVTHVLWAQGMSHDDRICLLFDHRICSIIVRHILCSQGTSCDLRAYPMIQEHAPWSSGMPNDHVLWTYGMVCDHGTCPMIRRQVLRWQDMSYGHMLCPMIIEHGTSLRSHGLSYDHSSFPVIRGQLVWSCDMPYEHKSSPMIIG